MTSTMSTNQGKQSGFGWKVSVCILIMQLMFAPALFAGLLQCPRSSEKRPPALNEGLHFHQVENNVKMFVSM